MDNSGASRRGMAKVYQFDVIRDSISFVIPGCAIVAQARNP
jgi:hypothetical protein